MLNALNDLIQRPLEAGLISTPFSYEETVAQNT